ncbi:hypothetical protein GF373_16995, partial [bacterium]|nr:hypothetical protein [bacterium]
MKIGLEESYLGYFRYCVIMLVGGWGICHLIWHALDNLPISDDQVFYAVGAIRAIRHLGSMPFFDFLDSLKDITNMVRPPGASLLLAPFAFLLRYDIQLIKAASLAWYLLTFVSIYLLGKTYFNRETGLLGMVFFCFLPQMYHLEIDPEFYQMSLLPLVLVCCAHVWDQGRWNALWWLAIGLLTALGLLLKWVFAVYLVGPVLYMIWNFVSKIKNSTLAIHWMLPCKLCLMLLPVIGVFLWWYLPYWDRLVETIRMNTESMAYTPYKNGWEWSVPFYYPFQFLWYNKLFPTMCLLIGLLVSLLTYTVHDRAGSMKTHTQYRSGWNLIAVTLIAFLLFFSIRYENIPKKYMFPLLPLLSVYAVSWIPLLTRFITRRRMHNAFLLYGLFCILWINFGIPEVNALYYSPRNFYKNPKKEFLWYALPNAWVPDDNHWPFNDLAKSLHHLQGNS